MNSTSTFRVSGICEWISFPKAQPGTGIQNLSVDVRKTHDVYSVCHQPAGHDYQAPITEYSGRTTTTFSETSKT